MPIQTTMAPYGIMPVPTADTKPIWDGAKEGKLVVLKCGNCGFYNWPPQPWCGGCKDPDYTKEWATVSGRGTVYCWYICHDTSITGYEEKVPYAVLLVELEEQKGLLLMSNLLNHEYGTLGEGITNGMPVEVVFDKASDDIFVPQFQPRK